MKKPILILTAVITALSMIVNVYAVQQNLRKYDPKDVVGDDPNKAFNPKRAEQPSKTQKTEQTRKSKELKSHGGIIGDIIETGIIAGYYSPLAVFGTDEDGNMLALAVSANLCTVLDFGKNSDPVDGIKSEIIGGQEVTDVYSIVSFRCGNTDDTGFFDDAVALGTFDNNDYAVYRIRGGELNVSAIATDFSVGDKIKIFTKDPYVRSSNEEEKYYNGEITSVDGGTLKCTSDYKYDPSRYLEYGYNPADYPEYGNNPLYHLECAVFGTVYGENNELIGIMTAEDEIMTVSQIEGLMNSEHFVPIEHEEPERYEPAPEIDDDTYEAVIARFKYNFFMKQLFLHGLKCLLPAQYIQCVRFVQLARFAEYCLYSRSETED